MPEPEARTRRPKIATAERREARVPDRKGARDASQASRRANRTARQGCLAKHPAPSRRSARPSVRGRASEIWTDPDANAPRERKVLFEWVEQDDPRIEGAARRREVIREGCLTS